MSGSFLEGKISSACDELARLRGELHGGDPTPARREQIVREIEEVKDEQGRLQGAYDSAWQASLGPVNLWREKGGGICQTRSAGMGGGCGGPVIRPGNPKYAALDAELRKREDLDRRVAEWAYAQWGGWRGGVRVLYYGTGPEAVARVTRGGPELTVKLADLPA